MRARPRPPAPAYRSARRGFTLIEVLAALAVAGAMGWCVFGLISAQTRWRQRGEEVAEHGQRLAGFQSDLTADLRGVVPPHPKRSRVAPPQAFPSETRFETESFQEMFLQVRGTAAPQTVRFHGTPQALVLEVARGNPRFDEAAERTVVAWWCAGERAPRLPLLRSGDRPILVAALTDAPPGITRWSTSARTVLSAAAPNTLSDAAGQASTVFPQAASWTLAYFDGTRWHDQWDADLQEHLPVAVRVRWMDADGLPLPPLVLRLPTAAGGTSS